MAANDNGKSANPASLFGKQLKKERLARGWSLDELERRTKTAAGHWSRVENGKRPLPSSWQTSWIRSSSAKTTTITSFTKR